MKKHSSLNSVGAAAPTAPIVMRTLAYSYLTDIRGGMFRNDSHPVKQENSSKGTLTKPSSFLQIIPCIRCVTHLIPPYTFTHTHTSFLQYKEAQNDIRETKLT